MRSSILRTAVKTWRLRADAPFPSQIAARQRYRMKLLRAVPRRKEPGPEGPGGGA